MSYFRNLAVSAAAILSMTAAQQANAAGNSRVCDAAFVGYIQAVMQSYPGFDDNVIQIQLKGDNGTTYWFSSQGAFDVYSHPEGRTLLQLATSAYLAQSHVQVYQYACATQSANTPNNGTQTWQDFWFGLGMIP